ncbi:MAG: Hint domain-containing protein [Aphanocapsa sp. GSE-SYN-MK-11-07L]|nr:Hint domain-containing protein [Aphanocapsa sp. GSE-SYN-MK-11-07L]
MQSKPYGFVLGTLIHTPEGTRQIETIRPGDLVMSSAAGLDSKATPRRVLDVQTFPLVEIWHVMVQSLRVEESGAEEGYVLLSPHQPLGVMGKHDFESHHNLWAEMNVLPMQEYLGHPVDGWLLASDLYDSAGIVLCTFDRVGVDVFGSEPLFAMQNSDWAWGSHDSVEVPIGRAYDLRGNQPIRLNDATNDLDLDEISEEDIASWGIYPSFRRTIYSLSVEGENSYFVGKLGFLVQGLGET